MNWDELSKWVTDLFAKLQDNTWNVWIKPVNQAARTNIDNIINWLPVRVPRKWDQWDTLWSFTQWPKHQVDDIIYWLPVHIPKK